MRNDRFARMPEAASAYERGTELHEGLARYVERRAVRNPYVDLPEHGFAPDDLREGCYTTGHALAVLLDRVSPHWRQRLEWGETRPLDELLNDALHRCRAQEAQFSRDEIEDAAICAGIEVQTAGDRRRAIRDEYLGRPGHRLVVTAHKNGPLWTQAFDPSRVVRLESGQILHTRWIQLENERCTVEVLGRAALTEAVGDHPLFSGIHTITVTGIEIEPTIEEREGVIVVCSDGVKATCRDARISRDGETTRLRLGKGRC